MARATKQAARWVAILALSFVWVGASWAAPIYQVVDLGTFGGTYSDAFAINDLGQVVGTASTPGNAAQYAFLYSGGQMSNLGALGGTYGVATSINNLGQVVGLAGPTSGSAYHAFLYSGGQMSALFSQNGEAFGINDAGQVVGDYVNTPTTTHAFLYSGGTLIDLDPLDRGQSQAFGINASGQVVGQTEVSGVATAFRTAPNSLINPATDLLGTLGGSSSAAIGINASGQVVGTAETAHGGAANAFLTAPNSPINPATSDLGTLYGGMSQAQAVNDLGQVVGSSTDINGDQRAFLYCNGVLQDLNTLILPGSDFATLVFALGINDSGQIVGEGMTTNGEFHAFLATPVLEPSSFVMALLSLCLVCGAIGLRGVSRSGQSRRPR